MSDGAKLAQSGELENRVPCWDSREEPMQRVWALEVGLMHLTSQQLCALF